MANKENVKRMSLGKHQRDFSGPVTGTTDICMRLAFYIILRRVVERGGGVGRQAAIDHTHTVYEMVGGHVGHLTRVRWQPANGSAPCFLAEAGRIFFYYLKFDTIDFEHLNKRDRDVCVCVCVCVCVGGGGSCT